MKTYWGSGGTAPRILDLGTRWRWVVSFTLRPLCPQGKSHWYLLDRRLGGPQSFFGCGGEEKNSQPRRESNPRTPIVQPVAQRYTDWAITALPNVHRFINSENLNSELEQAMRPNPWRRWCCINYYCSTLPPPTCLLKSSVYNVQRKCKGKAQDKIVPILN
jgi:hypothetical protein